jgi:hypothetical protein
MEQAHGLPLHAFVAEQAGVPPRRGVQVLAHKPAGWRFPL